MNSPLTRFKLIFDQDDIDAVTIRNIFILDLKFPNRSNMLYVIGAIIVKQNSL